MCLLECVMLCIYLERGTWIHVDEADLLEILEIHGLHAETNGRPVGLCAADQLASEYLGVSRQGCNFFSPVVQLGYREPSQSLDIRQ